MIFEYNFRNYNFRLILYMIALSVLGVLVIRSATNMDESMVNRQIFGVVIGLTAAIGLSLLDYHRIMSLGGLVYAGCLALLAAVFLWGNNVNNAKRWIVLPGIGQIQPSEFVKIGLIVFFSWYFMKYQEKLNQPSTVAAAAALFAVPAYLVYAQPNLSTSLVR